ncbi:MAG: 50S ribosomal protein L10 [Candidatus Woesearchaeota archaeon]
MRRNKMAHVAEYKKRIVKEFIDLMKEYPIIGAVNLENMPAPQLQIMRKQLRGKVELRMTKRRLMRLIIEQAKDDKKGIEGLEKYLVGMPALLFTKENPFSLFKIIKKSKSKAPAKPGQIAPFDIEVKAGPTQFAPGPIISELSSLGLKTGVEEGKVVIKADAIVVKEGEKINDNAASMLLRLGIEPMEIGLDVTAVFEDGIIYDKKTLNIDEEQFMKDLVQADQWAFNLAVDAGIHNKRTTEFMIQKAFRESKAIAIDLDILTDETVGIMLGKAEAQAKSLKADAKIPDAEEKKVEEKAEEERLAEAPKKKEKAEEPKVEEEKKKEVKDQPAEEKKEEKVEEKPKLAQVEKEEQKEEPKKEVKEEETPVEDKTEEESKEDIDIEEENKPEEKSTDDKVKDMVKKAKDFAEKKIPSADDLLKD